MCVLLYVLIILIIISFLCNTSYSSIWIDSFQSGRENFGFGFGGGGGGLGGGGGRRAVHERGRRRLALGPCLGALLRRAEALPRPVARGGGRDRRAGRAGGHRAGARRRGVALRALRRPGLH